jgi:hypothetical protein
MKIFSFISSIIAAGITIYYVITDLPSFTNFNGVIYFILLMVLLAICITGIILNVPHIVKPHRKSKHYHQLKH